jgi:hypothetical protein
MPSFASEPHRQLRQYSAIFSAIGDPATHLQPNGSHPY